MPKLQISLRISEATKSKLDWLAEQRYGTQTEAVAIALDRLYQQEAKAILKGFYISGGNGSYVELSDGRYADTVTGETSEPEADHLALQRLMDCAEVGDWVTKEEWMAWSHWDNDQKDIEEYVAA